MEREKVGMEQDVALACQESDERLTDADTRALAAAVAGVNDVEAHFSFTLPTPSSFSLFT
jgi:hypothetical protein